MDVFKKEELDIQNSLTWTFGKDVYLERGN